MSYCCELYLDKLEEQCKSSGLRYKPTDFFGDISDLGDIKVDIRNRSVIYNIIEDTDAEFINVFGCMVDVKSGNIALGYNPNPNSYVLVGNMFDIIRECCVKESKRKLVSNEDCKYILEMLKLQPFYYANDIESALRDKVDDTLKFSSEYKSITINIIKSENEKKFDTGIVERYIKSNRGIELPSQFTNVIAIAIECVRLYDIALRFSKHLFGNFICEDNYKSVWTKSEDTYVNIVNKRDANLESICTNLIGVGFHPEFVLGMKSYSLGVKQLKDIVKNVLKFIENYKNVAVNASTALNFIKSQFAMLSSLSSFSYIGDRVFEYRDCFNIIDILRCKGWEQNLIFAVEILKKYKQRALFDVIVKKFNLTDVFLECKITEDLFIESVESYYSKRFVGLRDTGSCYTRGVLPSQYSFTAFSPIMIESSGRIFEDVSKKVLKVFKEV